MIMLGVKKSKLRIAIVYLNCLNEGVVIFIVININVHSVRCEQADFAGHSAHWSPAINYLEGSFVVILNEKTAISNSVQPIFRYGHVPDFFANFKRFHHFLVPPTTHLYKYLHQHKNILLSLSFLISIQFAIVH